MAIEKSALRVSELDFLEIRENLKTYLRSQSEFQDFDFEGSGMAVLLDILAYNTHYMSYYLNMIGNEMFLDTAQLRESIISHAKLMNYVPGSAQGALAKVNIKVTPSNAEDNTSTILTLNKYTRLLGTDKDGINYPFVTLYSNTVSKNTGTFNFANVIIKQGEVITLQYLMDSGNETRRFEIPSANVDTETIVIGVQESSSNTDTTIYNLADDITEVTANSTVYFIEENEKQNYTFYFGDDVIGKKPKNGNIIICTYLDNSGSITNNISRFVFTEDIGGYTDNISVSSTTGSYGGIDKEGIEQVRFRAPYFYTTQNRAVTVNDYETLLLKDYPNIEAVSVWGGEDNDPVVYGKVFLSLKTKNNYQLTNLEKETIKEELIQKRNVLTVTPEIIDPEYTYIMIDGKVYYDSTLTSLSSDEIKQLAIAAIQDYSDNELNQFSSIFRKSKLQSYLENSEKSITGSDIDVLVQKRLLIDTERTRTYTVNFNMPLAKTLFTDNILHTYPEITVFDSAGVARNVFVEEIPTVNTGIDSIEILSGGINYQSAPTVTIVGDGTGAKATALVVGGCIQKITVTSPGENYSSAIVELSGGEGTGGSVRAILQSRKGTLRSFYYKTSREKVIVNPNFGTIDYDKGIITINSLRATAVIENDYYEDGYLTLTVPAENENIFTQRNRILSIDYSDARSIQLVAMAE
jgi:hypothetical protein